MRIVFLADHLNQIVKLSFKPEISDTWLISIILKLKKKKTDIFSVLVLDYHMNLT